MLFNDIFNAGKPETVSQTLCCCKNAAEFAELFLRGEICKRDIEPAAIHVHINTDEPVLRRESHACIDCIVEQISENAAQVNFGYFKFHGNMCINADIDFPCFCK